MNTIRIVKNEWPDSIPDKLVLPCSVCGCRVDFDYLVDDDFWNKIVPIIHRRNVVCLRCLDRMATTFEENICTHIQPICFCGEGKTIILNPVMAYVYVKS